MKLYICWSTNGSAHHDCHKAYQGLVDAGHSPELVKARGQEHLPKFLQFKVRREVHALTGSFFVPVLVLEDGTAINKPTKSSPGPKPTPSTRKRKPLTNPTSTEPTADGPHGRFSRPLRKGYAVGRHPRQYHPANRFGIRPQRRDDARRRCLRLQDRQPQFTGAQFRIEPQLPRAHQRPPLRSEPFHRAPELLCWDRFGCCVVDSMRDCHRRVIRRAAHR